MMGRSHLTIGVATSTAALLLLGVHPVLDYQIFSIGVGVGSLASLLPDIDGDPNAKGDPLFRSMLGVGNRQTTRNLGRHFQRGEWLLLLVGLIPWLIARLINILARLLPHRGITHWALTAFLLFLLVTTIALFLQGSWLIGVAFFVGYLSHLMADMMTVSGVPFWGGLQKPAKKVHVTPKALRFRTGVDVFAEAFAVFLIVVTSGLFSALGYWGWHVFG